MHATSHSVMIGRRFRATLIVASVVLAVSALSCDDGDPPRKQAGAASAPGPLTPTSTAASTTPSTIASTPVETVAAITRLRRAGRLRGIEAYLLPAQRDSVIELIQTMDRLLAANDTLQAAVVEHLGPASARAFDRSEAANALGVFSREVAVIGERITGDSAVVTVQIADRVPLEEVNLTRRDGRWVVVTDAPIPEVAKELGRLAEVLSATARLLESKPMTAAELRRELAARQEPIGRRLAELTSTAP